jgi:hypothetical protein
VELTRLERHLARSWAEAWIPEIDGAPHGGVALDAPFWRRFDRCAPMTLAVGFRAALLLASIARFGRSRTRCLEQWSRSSNYLVRQLVMVLRVVFTLAHFSQPAVRRRLP